MSGFLKYLTALSTTNRQEHDIKRCDDFSQQIEK